MCYFKMDAVMPRIENSQMILKYHKVEEPILGDFLEYYKAAIINSVVLVKEQMHTLVEIR